MNKSKPAISLCMIVKDEEEVLLRCLESVRSIICQAIVVDTGSTDRTVEIAEGFGAEVLHFQWCGDFSAARNYSLQKAVGDWVLVLDADEVIAPQDLAEFSRLIADPNICTQFSQRHYTSDHRVSNFIPAAGEFPGFEQGNLGYFETECVRLFPNRHRIEFRGVVHEMVEPSIREQGRHSIQKTDIRIHHFGHVASVQKKKDKASIYQPLSGEKARLSPGDWQSHFELGISNSCARRFNQAAAAFARSIELNPHYAASYTNYGYVLAELGQFPQAIAVLEQAMKISPHSAEPVCNLGAAYLRQADFETAERILRQAVALNPKFINARCNLAQALAYQRRFDEAEAEYLLILQISPDCITALTDLAALYLQTGKNSESEQVLRRALETDPSADRARLILLQLLEHTGRDEEAAEMRSGRPGLKNLSPFNIS